jgi:hypothetical protein
MLSLLTESGNRLLMRARTILLVAGLIGSVAIFVAVQIIQPAVKVAPATMPTSSPSSTRCGTSGCGHWTP